MELGTVSHRTSVLSQSLDSALESFTFGNCSSVDLVAFCKDISLDHIAKIVLCCVLKLELSHKSLAGYASLCKMSHLSLVNTMSVTTCFLPFASLLTTFSFLSTNANLHCTVSIVLYCLDLCY